jgi:cyclase
MHSKRIIPCLDIKNGRTVKGIHFVGLREIGDPVEMAQHYEKEGADELAFLDISATLEGRKTFVDLVQKIAAKITVPFVVGGGITSVEDARALLSAGASKVSINSAAVMNPQLINDLVFEFGSEAVVIAIDAKQVDGRWMVVTHGGERVTDKELIAWAKEAEQRGAGEILFTSMDHDGTKKGFPIETYAALAEAVKIPIIASGGAGSADDMIEVLTRGKADAALAASIFHYGEVKIGDLKRKL